MECNEPNAINNEQLLAHLAGETVEPSVAQHLTTCHYCSSQMADYRHIELMLTSKLYRWDCPTNQTLGEYQLGLLTSDLSTAVKVHLSLCTLCTAELATLTAFLANDPMLVEHASVIPSSLNNHRPAHTAEDVLEHIRNQARAGVRRIIAAWQQPAQPRLSFERGPAARVWPRLYTAEDVSISIQIERGRSRTSSLQLIGFVTRSGAALKSLAGTPVLLSSQASTMHTQNIDELGNFIFPSLPPATYTLELQFPENTIVIDQLPITLQD